MPFWTPVLSCVCICKFITCALVTRGFWNASLIGMIATPGGVNYRTDVTWCLICWCLHAAVSMVANHKTCLMYVIKSPERRYPISIKPIPALKPVCSTMLDIATRQIFLGKLLAYCRYIFQNSDVDLSVHNKTFMIFLGL